MLLIKKTIIVAVDTLDDDEIEGIPYWAEQDAVSTVAEEEYNKYINSHHVQRRKTELRAPLEYLSEPERKPSEQSKTKVTFNPKPQYSTQEQQKRSRGRPKKEETSKQPSNLVSPSPLDSFYEQWKHDQTKTAPVGEQVRKKDDSKTPLKTTGRSTSLSTQRCINISEELLLELIPTTFDALDINVDELYRPRRSEDTDSDSVSFYEADSSDEFDMELSDADIDRGNGTEFAFTRLTSQLDN